MRIALVSTPYVSVPPRQYGGTELVIHELAEGLVRRGHEVELFATGDSHGSATLHWLYETAQWPPELITGLDHVTWAMQRIVERGPFDVVHAHSAIALGCARLAPALPLVYTIHHEREEWLSALYAHCRGAHYVMISHDQRRREIALPHVDVIHHGLDPAKYRCAGHATGDYVAFVGRLARQKGPHTAIDAARVAGVPIRVAGEVHPPDRAWADAELRQRLALPHVRYEGSLALGPKAALLCHARALLAPVEWNEPFGLILIEAMLSGCPVVGFGRGSLPELIEEGVTGFVATSPEQMAELIRPGGAVDHVDRRRCRARAVARFSSDRMVAEHLAVYERIARTYAPARALRALPGARTPAGRWRARPAPPPRRTSATRRPPATSRQSGVRW